MRLLGWMSKHIIVKSETHLSECRSSRSGRNRGKEDAITPIKIGAGSGEVSKVTCNYMEKSAEVIVPTGNELHKTAQVSQMGKD
ncbi:hypothetical protein [Zobellia galactanivorans]|uniref:Uncharacterized protein n=1 Tax=Zobellia galactanivorans (strain DSM 12802 / CCUG 47099 / CIP 106680 / NCIMB 13871 / Dsij) TaxID=63186 RepID=G0L8G0_ZOBGA|nr:hypothetical protein [Zobellia galactanivorans]CAZ97537.1 Putative protein [Zobellia galactanivorans]